MKPNRSFSLGVACSFALPFSLFAAPDSDTRAAAYRVSIAQDEVSKKTEEMHKAIQLVLQDFYQNHLQSTNANEAKQVAEQLSQLNDQQIKPLVDLLREIGTAEKEQTGNGRLENASKAQKEVQVRLKTLENNLVLHIDQASTRQRFVNLAQRQAANLRQTRGLAANGQSADLPRNEQNALGQEIGLAMEALKRVAAQTTDASRGRFVEAWKIGQQSNVVLLAIQAGTQTSEGQLVQAANVESLVFDGLQEVALRLEADSSAEDRLQAMKSQLEQMAAQQKSLADETAKGEPKDSVREEQAKIADQMAMMKADLKALSVGAADQLEKGAQTVNQALDQLNSPDKNQQKAIAGLQNSAAKQMQALGKTLDQQMKQIAAKAPQSAQEAMQNLANLDQEIRKLAEQQSAGGADLQTQQQMAAQAAGLQQQAAGLSPQAAQDLGAAASQMGQNPAAAAQALAQARTDLMQQMQASGQAASSAQQLAALSDQLGQALAQSQQASQSMGQQGDGDLPKASQQMQQAQQSLQKAQAATGAGTPAEAQQAMQEAQKNLQKAQSGAAKKEGGQAAAGANSEAQKALQAAQSAVGKALADAKAAAAGAPGPGQSGKPGQGGAPKQAQGSKPGMSDKPGEDGMAMDGHTGDGTSGGRQDIAASLGATEGVNARVHAGLASEAKATMAAFRKEKAPAEYQGMIQQYLLNLADGTMPVAPKP